MGAQSAGGTRHPIGPGGSFHPNQNRGSECCEAEAHTYVGRTTRQEETAMPFYTKGDVRIHYEEVGSGFPLLVTAGGGLNSRISNWNTGVFNAMEAFKDDFRCITMDQRNANGGESTGRSRSMTR